MTPTGHAARALHTAADALIDAAEHVANLEHAFRLRSDTIERLREDVETLKGQLLLVEHWMREREEEGED